MNVNGKNDEGIIKRCESKSKRIAQIHRIVGVFLCSLYRAKKSHLFGSFFFFFFFFSHSMATFSNDKMWGAFIRLIAIHHDHQAFNHAHKLCFSSAY